MLLTLLNVVNNIVQHCYTQLTIAKKIAACQFHHDALQAETTFNTSYKKFNLSAYVLVDDTLFSPILMP